MAYMKKGIATKRHQGALPNTITTTTAAPANDSRSRGPTLSLDSIITPHFIVQPQSLINHHPPLTRQQKRSQLNSRMYLKAALPTLLSLLVRVIAWTVGKINIQLLLADQGMIAWIMITDNKFNIVGLKPIPNLQEAISLVDQKLKWFNLLDICPWKLEVVYRCWPSKRH